MSLMGCNTCNGVGSYYTYSPGETFNGMGAVAEGFVFNGSQAWADWLACANAWQASQSVIPQCKKAVDAFRAALGKMGYGALGLGTSWDSSDQAAYQSWLDKNGLPPSPAGRGMPAKAHMGVMEQQANSGKVTGSQPVVDYAKVNGEIVPASAVATAQAGMGGSIWLLLGAAAVGVGLIYVVKKKKGSKGHPAMKARMSQPTSLDSPGQRV